MVEFKSRYGPVKSSDIVQLIATAVAVKDGSGYQVKYGYIETGGGEKYRVNLDKPCEELLAMIAKQLLQARKIACGEKPVATPDLKKCSACGFRNECYYAKLS